MANIEYRNINKNNKNSKSTNTEEEGRQEGEESMWKGERF